MGNCNHIADLNDLNEKIKDQQDRLNAKSWEIDQLRGRLHEMHQLNDTLIGIVRIFFTFQSQIFDIRNLCYFFGHF